jgi:DNA polymerase III gamma/tau subunit
LGYKPPQFSAKVLDVLDSVRLEQALEILLACYRDIRYSVSPRFEFETAVTKLSWLDKWVSPAELKDALNKAQYVLRSQVAGGNLTVAGAAPEQKPVYAANTQSGYSEKKSLAEEYRKRKAEKASAPSDNGADEDLDAPPWSGIINTENQGDMSQGDKSPGDISRGDLSPVDRVLKHIPGTIIN